MAENKTKQNVSYWCILLLPGISSEVQKPHLVSGTHACCFSNMDVDVFGPGVWAALHADV